MRGEVHLVMSCGTKEGSALMGKKKYRGGVMLGGSWCGDVRESNQEFHLEGIIFNDELDGLVQAEYHV
jgi:hypothetical protein